MTKNKKKQQQNDKKLTEFKPPKLEGTPLKFSKDNQNMRATVVERKPTETETNEELLSQRCKEVTGVNDTELANSILFEAARALAPMIGEEQSKNVIAQSLHDFQPKDAIEARLAAQAAVVYTYAMASVKRSGEADMLCHIEAMINLGIKLMRVHNETVDALNRYRRGGEQKVIVTHAVVAGQAVVNNFNGMGVSPENKGDTPCSRNYAEPKHEPTTINHAVNPQWQTEDAGFMEAKVVDPRQKKVSGA